MLGILEATQAAYGYLPVAALKRISQDGRLVRDDLRHRVVLRPSAFRAADGHRPGRGRRRHRPTEATYLAAFDAALGGRARPAAGARLTDGRRSCGRPPDWPGSCSRGPAPRTRRTSTGRARPAPSRACVGRSVTSGATATIADDRVVRAARSRRRRLPGRRQVAAAATPTRPAATSWPTATAPTRPRSTDRTLIERDPFAVIEGLAIAAFAIGATEAFVAVRAEDTEAIARARGGHRRGRPRRASRRRRPRRRTRPHGQVRPVQGAYMLGEETVLLKALEGKRGQPEQRPPHPAEAGPVRLPPSSTTSRPWPPWPWIVGHRARRLRGRPAPEVPGTVLVQIRTRPERHRPSPPWPAAPDCPLQPRTATARPSSNSPPSLRWMPPSTPSRCRKASPGSL